MLLRESSLRFANRATFLSLQRANWQLLTQIPRSFLRATGTCRSWIARIARPFRIRGVSRTLEGKTLFISGASRGIGLAIAVRASRDGANVALLAKTAAPTPYDAPGAAGGPDLYVQKDGFRETFCADVPVDMADVMFATQRPLAFAALNENATAAGWKSKPSWFLVSEHDNAISPDAERFMAQRMGATTDTIDGSHTAFIAKPVAVATFIRQALR